MLIGCHAGTGKFRGDRVPSDSIDAHKSKRNGATGSKETARETVCIGQWFVMGRLCGKNDGDGWAESLGGLRDCLGG